MRNRLTVAALVVGLLALGAAEAHAQPLKTFLNVPGIPGDSTDAQHPEWIEVLALTQGGTATRKSIVCSDLQVIKSLDRSGPPLWAAAALGQSFEEIRLEIVSGVDTRKVVYDVKLGNAKVTSISTSGSSELPIESVSFSYQTLTLTFNRQSSTGAIIPGVPQTIDCR